MRPFLSILNLRFKSLKIPSLISSNLNVFHTMLKVLFGRPDFSYSTNKEIINVTISFILTAEGFNCPLF